jgi:predicted Zn-dependent protease
VVQATVLGRRGRPREALALLEPWLERQPEDPTLHEALAEAWERAGELARARRAREAAAFWYRTDE